MNHTEPIILFQAKHQSVTPLIARQCSVLVVIKSGGLLLQGGYVFRSQVFIVVQLMNYFNRLYIYALLVDLQR